VIFFFQEFRISFHRLHSAHLKASFPKVSRIHSNSSYWLMRWFLSVAYKFSRLVKAFIYKLHEDVSKIFRTYAVKIINLITTRLWKLPTSTKLLATWHTDSLDMVVLPSTGTSRYHNCCIDGGTSPEYFGFPSYDWFILIHWGCSYPRCSDRCHL
jgi:hypothetical protein